MPNVILYYKTNKMTLKLVLSSEIALLDRTLQRLFHYAAQKYFYVNLLRVLFYHMELAVQR